MPIHRLTPADAPAYRALMLDAYTRHPDAFTSSVAERAGLPLAWWEARMREDAADGTAAQECVFGAWRGGALVGVAGLSTEQRERTRHKATLFGMVVAPACRGQGLGRRLVQAVLNHAAQRPGLRVVQLTVTQGNDAAVALYQRCGFVAWGAEPMAVALAGVVSPQGPADCFTKLHMARTL